MLTVAGATANPLLGGALLFVYALGTATPLLLIAYFWDRLNLGRRPWLRGRTARLGGWTVHTTNLVAGLLFIVLGASFIAFQGSSALSGVYDDLGLAELGFRLQSWIADRANGNADLGVAALALAAAAGLALQQVFAKRRAATRGNAGETVSSEPSSIAASETR